MRNCFTIVFEGDIRKLPFNPLTAETAYGKPLAAGVGDAFAQIEDFMDDLDPEQAMMDIRHVLGVSTDGEAMRKVREMVGKPLVQPLAQEPGRG